MKPSNLLLNFNKNYESLHDGDLSTIGLQPKLDAVGNWTEGYGKLMLVNGKKATVKTHPTLKSIMPFASLTTEAEAFEDMKRFINAIALKVKRDLKIEVTQNEFDALVSHRYNCGFSKTLYRLINSNAPDDVIKTFWTTKYITANGVALKGLQYRRNDEWQMFKNANYHRDFNLKV